MTNDAGLGGGGDDAVIHSSEARTTKGQKKNRGIVNCVALKSTQRNLRGKCFVFSREAGYTKYLSVVCC